MRDQGEGALLHPNPNCCRLVDTQSVSRRRQGSARNANANHCGFNDGSSGLTRRAAWPCSTAHAEQRVVIVRIVIGRVAKGSRPVEKLLHAGRTEVSWQSLTARSLPAG